MTLKTRTWITAAVIGLAVVFGFVLLSGGQLSYAQGPDGQPRYLGGTDSSGSSDSVLLSVPPRQPATVGPVTVIIELEEPSTGVISSRPGLTDAERLSAERGQLARVESAQQGVLAALTAGGVHYQLVGTTRHAFNGLIVDVDASQLETIRQTRGVKHAHIDRIGQLYNGSSVPFTDAPDVWDQGYTGAGIRIAIIDSGIDYNHTNFASQGWPPSAGDKIVGGWDFVGDTWNGGALPPGSPPGDSDPIDQNGHGSHVAGTAAGFGVDDLGNTYTGLYTSVAVPFGTMRIGPGVAPEAEIYAYRVGGYDAASGSVSEAATILAIEAAMDPNGDSSTADHVDVINLSLGGNFGDPNLGWTVACNVAAQTGIVVVAAAGNEGDTYFVQSDPATADWAISVAASYEAGMGLIVNTPGSVAGTYQAAGADFGPSSYSVTGDLVLVNDGSGVTTDGCTAPFVNAAAIGGNVALIDRGTCGYTTKVLNAQNAGATAVVIISDTRPIATMNGTAPTITIPPMLISLANGNTIKAAMGTATVNVTLDNTTLFGGGALLLDMSARGAQRQPTAGAIALKPDIAAPGAAITSTAFNTTDQGSDKNGTSMASPHVAGAAALMIQQNPSWSVQEIKALLMNTALRPVVLDPYRYGPARVGAGIVTLSSATNSPVIAYNTADPELVSLSFGVLNVTAAGTYTKSLTVENKGGYACDYTATFVDIVQQNDVSYSVTPGPITVNGNGGQANFQVALTVPDPAAWNEPHNHDPTVRETLSRARHWLSESSGYVELRGGNCPTLWVPVYAAPRPSADLSVTTDTIEVTDLVGTVDVEMVGTGLNTGSNYPYDEISMVSAFELAFTSDELGFTDQRAAADLEYVGITSNYLGNGSDIGNTKIFFGISAYGEWSSLSEETRFEISIDTDEDGTADFTLWNWNYGNPSGNDSSDEFVPVLRQIGGGYYGWPGDYVNWFAASLYDTVPFQNRVMFISVPASRLGLDASNTTFNYWIISRDMNYGDIDSTDVLSYDVAAQLQNFAPGGGSPLWLDQPGVILSVDYDLNVLDPTCILLLHHHNTDSPDNRAETVCIQEEVVRPPGDQDDTDEDSGSGGDGGNWTPPDQGDLSGVTGLPPTGYPPETEFRSTTWVWAVLAGVLVVFAAGLGSIYVYRKSDRKL